MRAMVSMLMAGVLAVVLALASAGCVGYAPGLTEPREGDDARGGGWVVNPALDDVASASLRHVLTRHPPTGEFAVGFPEWMSAQRASRIVASLEDSRARTLTSETAHLPLYHVAWVRVLGDSATAHVHRPMVGAGGAMSGLTQAYDVRCRGGVQRWHVTSVRAWGMGAMPEPSRHLLDAPAADDAGGADDDGA